MTGREHDVDRAHAEALDVNRTRDRIERWWRGGGLSHDPLVRQADYLLMIETRLDDPREWLRNVTAS